jgi:hypothetical protein
LSSTYVTTNPGEGRPVNMDPIQNRAHVTYHLAVLTQEAESERLAAAQRRARPPEPTRVRATIGRLLIGLGTAIAGTEPTGARRPA